MGASEDTPGETSGVATEDELLAGMKQEAQGGQESVDDRDRGGHDRAAGDGREGAQAEEKPAVTWVHLRDISLWDMVDAAGRVFHVPENAALLAVLVVLLLKLSGVSGAIVARVRGAMRRPGVARHVQICTHHHSIHASVYSTVSSVIKCANEERLQRRNGYKALMQTGMNQR